MRPVVPAVRLARKTLRRLVERLVRGASGTSMQRLKGCLDDAAPIESRLYFAADVLDGEDPRDYDVRAAWRAMCFATEEAQEHPWWLPTIAEVDADGTWRERVVVCEFARGRPTDG